MNVFYFTVFSIFLILVKETDTCARTQSSTPIVCSCTTSNLHDVELLDQVDGTPGAGDTIQPTGNVTATDSNQCPTSYTVTCTPSTATGNILMQFQDQLGGALSLTSVVLTCDGDGDWIYTTSAGSLLVTSVQCQQY